jgi:thioredoxin-like negative regulator of GroEL
MKKLKVVSVMLCGFALASCGNFIEKVEVKACVDENNKAVAATVAYEKTGEASNRKKAETEYGVAKILCEKAIKKEPKNINVQLSLVNAYTCLGEYKKAQKIVDTLDNDTGNKAVSAVIKRANEIKKDIAAGKTFDCFSKKNVEVITD